jgi:hypothetical protein
MRDTTQHANTPGKFLNCREWRSFVTAVQCAVTSPKAAGRAAKSNPLWVRDRAARTSWLMIGGSFSSQRS